MSATRDDNIVRLSNQLKAFIFHRQREESGRDEWNPSVVLGALADAEAYFTGQVAAALPAPDRHVPVRSFRVIEGGLA